MQNTNIVNRLSMAAAATSFGDALYSFAVPLLIFQITKDPLVMGLQVAAAALGNLLGSYAVRRYMLTTSDKAATIGIDSILAATVLVPALTPANLLVAALFLTSFFNAALQTARSGYYESFVGHVAEGNSSARQQIIGRIKTLSNAGSLLGYAAAAPLALVWPLGGVLGIAAAMYVLSALSMSTLASPVVGARRASSKPAMQILFGMRLRSLTVGHGLGAFALFIVNASVVITLVGHFHVGPGFVSAYFVCHFLGAMLGSFALAQLARRVSIGVVWGPYLRVAYALPFFLISVFDDRLLFVGAIAFLGIVHAFSLPIWQSYFQSSAPADQWRVVGASRKSLVAVCGAGSAALTGWLLGITSYQNVFLLGGFAALLSAVALLFHANSEKHFADGMVGQNEATKA